MQHKSLGCPTYLERIVTWPCFGFFSAPSFVRAGIFALGGQWGSSGLRKDALLWRRDEGGLGSPHVRVYGRWPTADARRVAPG